MSTEPAKTSTVPLDDALSFKLFILITAGALGFVGAVFFFVLEG